MRSLSFLAFVVLTFCCWGVYGPVLHIGQEMMGEGPGKLSSLRPFICVGIAYFLIAVVYPLVSLKSVGETGRWSASGFLWSFVAGAIGAIGALGIILAFKFQGKPVYVMPLVFGLAPIVNTFVTMLMSGTIKQASFLFYLGILLVAIGAAGVLRFKPTQAKPAVVDQAAMLLGVRQGASVERLIRPVSLKQQADQEPGAAKPEVKNRQGMQPPGPPQEAVQDPKPTKRPVNQKLKGMAVQVDENDTSLPGNDNGLGDAKAPKWQDKIEGEDEVGGEPARLGPGGVPALNLGNDQPAKGIDGEVKGELVDGTEPESDASLWLVAACIGITALCWGAYGPVLHKGQAQMAGSRLRPFLCVGLAYFAIAVIVPLFLQGQFPREPGGWDYQGAGWSLLAGAAGAVGALGIIYAFNFGGKPIFVMPLVFGFAPVINTLTETFSKNLLNEVSVYFIVALAMVIVGAVMVLIFAPRKKPANQPATT